VDTGTPLRDFLVPTTAFPGPNDRPVDPAHPKILANNTRLSPDGSVLARAWRNGAIGLWDAPSGRWIGWLDDGHSVPTVIDFSPDGRTLVARRPEEVVLWNMQTRRPERTIATQSSYPAVCYAPDGKSIACAVDGSVQFMDPNTGGVLSRDGIPDSAGIAMVFHPGGSILFASAFEPVIRLLDTRTGRELLRLQKHTALIQSLLLTPDGATLISSDTSGTVLVWDLGYYNDRIRRELEYREPHGVDR
jgi:WD40 repeat protein